MADAHMAISVNGILGGPTGDRRGQGGAFDRPAARLASGQHIVDAADDAAGLAIADRLRRDYFVAGQAIRNASDGMSALRVAEGGLGQIGDITTRLAELATRAASGLLDDAQHGALAAEFAALGAEADRIAQTTALDGRALSFHVGLDGSPESEVTVTPPDATAAGLGLAGLSVATRAEARTALDALAGAQDHLAEGRSAVAATQARLTSVVATLARGAEQSVAAAARIADADVASETAHLVRARVLEHARVAVLAQANQAAGVVLDLLV